VPYLRAWGISNSTVYLSFHHQLLWNQYQIKWEKRPLTRTQKWRLYGAALDKIYKPSTCRRIRYTISVRRNISRCTSKWIRHSSRARSTGTIYRDVPITTWNKTVQTIKHFNFQNFIFIYTSFNKQSCKCWFKNQRFIFISIIMVNVVNDPTSLTYIPVCQINKCLIPLVFYAVESYTSWAQFLLTCLVMLCMTILFALNVEVIGQHGIQPELFSI
jgi:hypothetical protein